MHHTTTGAPAPTTPAPLGLATTAEAQAYLSLSRTTIYKLTQQGRLTPLKIGRALRFRWRDLQALAGEQGGVK